MRRIYVEPEMLVTSASRINDSNSEFVRLRNKLNDDVDYLASSWSGKDNRSFADQVKANNVDFFTKQISSMFPSTSPSDLKHWNISFQGVPVLRENEKLALKHILSENWNNTSITIDSSESDPEETAQILIRIDEYTTSTMTFEITVNAGNEESPTSRDFNVTLSDGTWKTAGASVKTVRDGFSTLSFDPIVTESVRLVIRSDSPCGIIEWQIR